MPLVDIINVKMQLQYVTEHPGRVGNIFVGQDGGLPLVVFHQLDDVEQVVVGNGDAENRQGGVLFHFHFGTAPGQDGIVVFQVVLFQFFYAFINGADFHRNLELGKFFGRFQDYMFQGFIGRNGQQLDFMVHRDSSCFIM